MFFFNIVNVMIEFFCRSMCEGEIGIHARQSVALIAEVLPYSTYLRNCLKELVNVNIECSSLVSGKYLEILLECVTLVGKLVGTFYFCLNLSVNFYFSEIVFNVYWFSMFCY